MAVATYSLNCRIFACSCS